MFTYVFFEILQLLSVLEHNKLDALINRVRVIVVDVLETTEIALLDDNKDILVMSKLQSPTLRQGIQQYVIKIDI